MSERVQGSGGKKLRRSVAFRGFKAAVEKSQCSSEESQANDQTSGPKI